MWVVSVHWQGRLWSQLWANPATVQYEPAQEERRVRAEWQTYSYKSVKNTDIDLRAQKQLTTTPLGHR